MSLSEYEKKRLQNIKENQELLSKLNLPNAPASRKTSVAKPQVTSKQTQTKKKAPAKRQSKEKEPPAPRRESKRLKKIMADPEEIDKIREEEEAERERLREEAEAQRHQDHSLDLILSSIGDTSSNRRAAATLKNTLTSLSALYDPQNSKAEDPDIKSLTKSLSSLNLKSITKFTPERIYMIAVHHDPQKDLIFGGDKVGNLGICDATIDARSETKEEKEEGEETQEASISNGKVKKEDEDEDVDEDEETINTWTMKVHTGSISHLAVDKASPHTVYSASYDCTLRSLNFETNASSEILNMDILAQEYENKKDALLSSFDITPDGREMWLSDNRGGIVHLDLRAKATEANRWRISTIKVGCLSINPQEPQYLLTSHLNREMRIWDNRIIRKSFTQSSEPEDISEAAKLTYFTHGFACSSAYWDPSGKHIVSTAYDNACRVWNVSPNADDMTSKIQNGVDPSVVIPHNNQTGRYVTVLKARWSIHQNSLPHFTIGSLDHDLGIYAYDGTRIASLYDTSVTATPAATASHPSIVERAYGATASGKVMVWAP